MINASVGGKTTYWMLETGHLKINDDIDYCFVYGGANDMMSLWTNEHGIKNSFNQVISNLK